MSISRIINENTILSATVAIGIIVGACVWMVHGSTAIEPRYYYGYFYDLQTGKLYVNARSTLPPTKAPSGPENGVMAAVFSCGQCDKKATHFTAWLEKYSPEAREAMTSERGSGHAAADPRQMKAISDGHLIAPLPETGKEPQWLPASGSEAARIMPAALKRCGNGDGRPMACNPVAEDLP